MGGTLLTSRELQSHSVSALLHQGKSMCKVENESNSSAERELNPNTEEEIFHQVHNKFKGTMKLPASNELRF